MPPKKRTKPKKPKPINTTHEDITMSNGIITDVRHFPTPFPPDLPPFDKENIELWFNRVEVIFASNYIHREDLQCAFVLAALDKTTITKIRHRQGESETPYTDIKNCLTRWYTKRANAKLDKLLKKTLMGLSKPSVFFNALQVNFGPTASEFFLTGLFLESLPLKIRSELPVRDKDLKNLVAVADKLYENMTKDRVASASPSQRDINISNFVDMLRERPNQIPHEIFAQVGSLL